MHCCWLVVRDDVLSEMLCFTTCQYSGWSDHWSTILEYKDWEPCTNKTLTYVSLTNTYFARIDEWEITIKHAMDTEKCMPWNHTATPNLEHHEEGAHMILKSTWGIKSLMKNANTKEYCLLVPTKKTITLNIIRMLVWLIGWVRKVLTITL